MVNEKSEIYLCFSHVLTGVILIASRWSPTDWININLFTRVSFRKKRKGGHKSRPARRWKENYF